MTVTSEHDDVARASRAPRTGVRARLGGWLRGPHVTAFDAAERDVPAAVAERNLAGAREDVYWWDTAEAPDALPGFGKPGAMASPAANTADLAVVGGGYTGLWAALMAKERDPEKDVLLLEGHRCGWAASGRNGGFLEPSLTHGESNGEQHAPAENARLAELGAINAREIAETIERYGIDADYQPTGELILASEPHQVDELAAEAAATGGELLTGGALRSRLDTPLYRAGLFDPDGSAIVHPTRLAWGLRRAALEAGVRIVEHTPVRALEASTGRGNQPVRLRTDGGDVVARQVVLATNVFPALIKRLRWYTVPVYDHAIVTEPLTPEQEASIGWAGREGLADMNSRFHYIRPIDTPEGLRILVGGYDALYHFGRNMSERYEHSPETARRLAQHFAAIFPQLSDVRFSHSWGGAIDTCSRFFSFFDLSHGGRVASAAGFTGLGVAATRFAANVMLDQLSGERTELTELEIVKKKPLPFPPEPLAWLGVKATTAAMIRSDRNKGRRGLWLRTMDKVGMGFDS
ncbi:glycine/D-amino acid oxidase-like deaminating enzyme [Zhihengliuella halotolerans]|uniref:Glycine/D-amino acid oxidase-like deaminating enzyme n=1 Tax=Zhihengliuella halotolerans TaxID=370736 RepID=A0A4Q8AEH3_9MICC|nr:FAD-dependent oxidoreductase [Zhihengliuella halotolerans]RZU62628.1 glycine/D-amino acid oxidase-like deaminating enzyme [Zhihengliuella halotolerans]